MALRTWCKVARMSWHLATLVGLVVTGVSPALAQLPAGASEQLRQQLSPGDVITVVPATGTAVTGRLLRFGDTDLELRADVPQPRGPRRRLDLTIPYNDIRSLERRRDSPRNGALIGAAIGAGVTGAMFAYAAAVDYNEIDEWAPMYAGMGAILAGIGAMTGWVIDAARSKPYLKVYSSSEARSMRIRAGAIVSRGAGVTIVVSF